MPAGVTAQGLEIKTVEQINAEIFNAQLSFLGADLDTSPDQPLGQLNGIVATKAAELWELGQTAYNSFNRNAAEGFLLDTLGLLTGVPRLKATYSTVDLAVNLNVGTVLQAGVATANVTGQPNNRWVIVDSFTAPSTGTFSLRFRAVNTGPNVANAGTITTITTAIAGWNSVTNPLGAETGREQETDDAYRARQATLLSAPGSSTVDAIRADMLAISTVQQARVFENTTMNTDANGLPAKSFEVVIYDQMLTPANTIAQAIWDSKPAGIQVYGTSSGGNAQDSLGNSIYIPFSYATVVNLEVALTYTPGPGFGVNTVANMQQRIRDVAANNLMGQDVVLNQLRSAAMAEPGCGGR